jgi:predicted transcriptional regulator
MGLRDSLDEATISQMNCRPVVAIDQSATVRQAVEAMRKGELGCIVILDESGAAIGMFTEAVLRHRLNESAAVLDEPVTSHMVERFAWVLPTDAASTVLDAMDVHNTRFIAVLDEHRKPVGITGQKTLVEFIADYYPRLVLTEDPTGITTSLKREGA